MTFSEKFNMKLFDFRFLMFIYGLLIPKGYSESKSKFKKKLVKI